MRFLGGSVYLLHCRISPILCFTSPHILSSILTVVFRFRVHPRLTRPIMRFYVELALLTAVVQLSSYVAAVCYYPNGDINGDIRCNEGVGATFCCGAGWACLSNKLCYQKSSFARGSCTDQTRMKPLLTESFQCSS